LFQGKAEAWMEVTDLPNPFDYMPIDENGNQCGEITEVKYSTISTHFNIKFPSPKIPLYWRKNLEIEKLSYDPVKRVHRLKSQPTFETFMKLV
jgi:hypothetical protein